MRIWNITCFFYLFFSCNTTDDKVVGEYTAESHYYGQKIKSLLSVTDDKLILYPYINRDSRYTLSQDTLTIFYKDPFGCNRNKLDQVIQFKIKISENFVKLKLIDSISPFFSEDFFKGIQFKRLETKESKFTNFEFISSECYGQCPSFYLQIDSIGKGYYYGVSNNCRNEFYKLKISNFARLKHLIQLMTTKISDTIPEVIVYDAQMYNLTIATGSKQINRTINYPEIAPVEISALISYILDNYNDFTFQNVDSSQAKFVKELEQKVQKMLFYSEIQLQPLHKFTPPKDK